VVPFIASGALAATDDWVGHLVINPPPLHRVYDGAFGDTFNWSTGAVPGSADTAEFNAAQAYTVTFGNNFTNAALTVSGGSVTFASPGVTPTYTVGSADISAGLTLSDFQLTSTGAVSVSGSGAALTVQSDAQGSAASRLLSGNIAVGAGLGRNGGALTVDGSRATIAQLGGATLSVGGGALLGGGGALRVQNGATLTTGTGSANVGRGGLIAIAGGTFQENGNLTVNAGRITGDSTANFRLAIGSQFDLQAGGRADFAADVFFTANSTTTDGSTSYFNNTANTYVGSSGHSSAMIWQNGATGTLGGLILGGTADANSTGTVFVQSGATVTSGRTEVGAANLAGQTGTLTVTGAGSMLTANGSTAFTIGGTTSTGTVNANTGGVVASSVSTVIAPLGHVSLNGGAFNASDVTVHGTLQGDAAGTLSLGNGSHLAVSSGGRVDLAGTITAPGAQITVDGATTHFNVGHALSMGDGGLTASLTLSNSATSNLSGGLLLASGSTTGGQGAATIQGGARLTVGNVNVGTGGLDGQSASLTVTGFGSMVTQSVSGTTAVGAAASSTGALTVSAGATYSASTLQINSTGTVSVIGGTLGLAGLAAFGGSLQADAASTVNFAEGAMTNVQNAGRVDLAGPVSMRAAVVSVSGAGSHFNAQQPVIFGNGTTGQNGILDLENGATGNFPGGITLLESFDTTGTASVQNGARLTAGDLSIGADGNSANSSPQLFLAGAGSFVTQTGAATLAVGEASGASTGLLKVQDGATFTSGTGPAVVSANSTLQVLGGTFNANGDITFSASTFTVDPVGRFVLAPGKTVTFKTSAMVTLRGTFTGGNVDNEVSLEVGGGTMSVQAFDGEGDLMIDAPVHFAADHVRQSSLTLSGRAAVRPQAVPDTGASASSLGRLTILGAGQLDLGNNLLTLHYPPGQSPQTTIRSYLASGYNNGAWNGPGIASSAAGGAYALGFADSADGVVAGLSANTVIVKYTQTGDLNLDGSVAFSDLLALAQHYGQPSAKWDQGDINYDGTVNFSDLLALAQNYGGSLASVAGPVAGIAPVPDPLAVPLVLAGALFPRRRVSRGRGLQPVRVVDG
jgi:hypothetical protein